MKRIGAVFISFFLLLVGSASYSLAQDPGALESKIDTLTQRVAELEQQLAAQNTSTSPVVGPFTRPVSSSWDPFDDMMLMQQRMDHMMGRMLGNAPSLANGGLYDPDTDLKETDNQYLITMDLPGMDKDRINIETKDGMLLISGERSSSESEEGNRFFRQERSFGYFSRSVPLPENANKDDISADYENGVLSIKIGKIIASKNPKKTTKIQVK